MRIPSIRDMALHDEITLFLQGDIPSFEVLCKGLTDVCRRSSTFRLVDYEQEGIYQSLLKLKNDGLQDTQNIPPDWVTSTTIRQWMMVLSYCENFPKREIFLNVEVKLIEQMKNLKEISVIAQTVCRTLSYLPNLFNIKNPSSLLQSLWPHLISIKQDNKPIGQDDICDALEGLRRFGQEDEILQKTLSELTWHVAQNAAMGHWFDGNQVAQAFLGLQSMSATPAVKALLIALLKHIEHLTQAKQWINSQEMELLMRGMGNMPTNDLTSAILQQLTLHIQEGPADGISRGFPSLILNGLRKMEESKAVEQFLIAIKLHFERHYQQGKVSTTYEMSEALPGLRHLSNLPVASEVLNLFASNLIYSKLIILPHEIYLRRWVADAIYYLADYFEHPTGKYSAINLINTVVTTFKPIVSLPIDTNTLSTTEGRHKIIIDLGGFVVRETQQIDLTEYPYSFEFAEFLATMLKSQVNTHYTGWNLVLDANYNMYEQERLHILFRDQLGILNLQSLEGKKKHFGLNRPLLESKEKPSEFAHKIVSEKLAGQAQSMSLPPPSERHKRARDEMNSNSEDTISEALDSSASHTIDEEEVSLITADKPWLV